MKSFNIDTPLSSETIKQLKVGDLVNLTGVIYTARDKVHKELTELIYKGSKLPFELKGAIIYYCGPTPNRKGDVIGSCGPTTSSRMDEFTPSLYKLGVSATIGKGERSEAVIDAVKRYKGIYFITWGGCGAYLRTFVKSSRIIAFSEFGTEAVRKLEIRSFPVVVAIDSKGRTIFK